MAGITKDIISDLSKDIFGVLGNESKYATPKFKYDVKTFADAVHQIAHLRSIPKDMNITKGDKIYRALRQDLIWCQQNYESFEQAFQNLSGRKVYIQGKLFTPQDWMAYKTKEKHIIEPNPHEAQFRHLDNPSLTALLSNMDKAELDNMYLTNQDSKKIIDRAMQRGMKFKIDDPAFIIHAKMLEPVSERLLQDIKKATGTEDSIEAIKENLSFDHFIKNSPNPDYYRFIEHLNAFINSIAKNDAGKPVCTLKKAYKSYKECHIKILNEVGKEIFKFSNKKLTMLPPEIGQLTKLVKLDVCPNSLSYLPNEIGKLTKLVSLDVSRNHLAFLPNEIGKLLNLKTFFANTNKLISLPPQLGQLTKLETLYIDHNKFINLPSELENLTRLNNFDASHNSLTELSFKLERLSSLRLLVLSHNLLLDFTFKLEKLTSLRLLDISNNGLSNKTLNKLKKISTNPENLLQLRI